MPWAARRYSHQRRRHGLAHLPAHSLEFSWQLEAQSTATPTKCCLYKFILTWSLRLDKQIFTAVAWIPAAQT